MPGPDGQASDRVECRICGRLFHSIGHHVRKAHDISANEYRDRFGILRSAPLTSDATRSKMSAAISRTIASGALDAHYATNAERASDAAAEGNRIKAELGRAGQPGTDDVTRARILTSTIEAVESGATIATAVKRSPIAHTTFFQWLTDFPELRERLSTAKSRQPTSIPRDASGRFTA